MEYNQLIHILYVCFSAFSTITDIVLCSFAASSRSFSALSLLIETFTGSFFAPCGRPTLRFFAIIICFLQSNNINTE